MSDSAFYLQPAFILQQRKYRESSLILDVLTKDFGIVSILAKGVRKKNSKTAGLLLAFTALKISYIGKNDLKTLTHVELGSSDIKLKGIALYCAFYVNEIVGKFLHKHDPHPEIYTEYKQCLQMLAKSGNVEQALRFFELNLIDHLGYGVELAVDANTEASVLSSKYYRFVGETGVIEDVNGYVSGDTLLTMDSRGLLNEKSLSEAKQLLRRIIDFQLQGKELKSRVVLAKIIKEL